MTEPIVAEAARPLQTLVRRNWNIRRASRIAIIGLLLSLLLTVLEGAFRKWVLAGALGTASYAAYLSKDILFAVLGFCRRQFLLSSGIKAFRKYLIIGGILIVAGSIVSGAQGVSTVGAALTLRSMIILPVLAAILANRLPPTTIIAISWTAAGAGVLNALLGAVQTRLPPDHLLNQYAIAEMYVVSLSTGVRAAGTFAYITGLAVMSTISVWSGLTLISSGESLLRKSAGWIAIISGIICALASVSRAPLIIDAAMVLCWAVFARLGTKRIATIALTAAAVLTLAAALGFLPTAERLSDALVERSQDTEENFSGRAFGDTEQALTAVALAPLGNGFGFEQVGGNYFSTGQLAFANFEGQMPRIVMDTTVFGLIGYVVVCVGALHGLQIAKRGTTSSTRAIILATQLLLLSIFYGSEVYNHTASSFAWIIFAAAMATANSSSQLALVRRG